MSGVRQVRFLICHRGNIGKVFKVAFSQRDASIYLFPYGATGRYFCGRKSLAEGEVSITFDFTEGVEDDQIPKLSYHETGQVHVLIGQQRVGPLHAIPLSDLRGEHTATVTIDSFGRLPAYYEELKLTGPERDVVISVEDVVESGRFAIYANGREANFIYHCPIRGQLRRPNLSSAVHIGIAPISQPPLGAESKGGVTVIAGWDSRKGPLQEQDFLYIRAE